MQKSADHRAKELEAWHHPRKSLTRIGLVQVRAHTYTRSLCVDIAVKEILGRQGHNVCVSNKIGKSLKGGLYEFKVGKSLSVLCNELGIPVPGGLGDDKELCLRVFFSVEGDRVVVLLAGYDKGKAPGRKKQDAEIEKARSLLAEHKEEVKRAKKGKKGR